MWLPFTMTLEPNPPCKINSAESRRTLWGSDKILWAKACCNYKIQTNRGHYYNLYSMARSFRKNTISYCLSMGLRKLLWSFSRVLHRFMQMCHRGDKERGFKFSQLLYCFTGEAKSRTAIFCSIKLWNLQSHKRVTSFFILEIKLVWGKV